MNVIIEIEIIEKEKQTNLQLPLVGGGDDGRGKKQTIEKNSRKRI